MARPCEYTPEKQALAEAYLDGGWETEGDSVPQIAGLAMAMGIDRTTAYAWAADEGKPEFSNIFTRVQALQERKLINKGLLGDFNPAITKMMLTKHGYSERQEVDHRSEDGSMTPARIEIVAPSLKNEHS